MGSAAGYRIPQSKQPLRLTQLINDDDPNFKKLKTVTKYLNNAQNFDEKLNRLGEFIRWHDDLTKAQSRLSSIKYWSWLILYTNITTLTEMCLFRNKQNNRIEGINQTNINKIKELFQMSPLNKRVPVDDAGNFVSYIINGIKENETVNFRKFFADQSGGKFIFDQLEEYNRQLKNDPTEQQKKAIQSYINCKETQEFLTLLTEYSSDGAHPLRVNKIKYELLNIQRLIDSKPIQIEEKTTISQDEFSKKDPIDSTKSHEIWNELKELGILNSNGTISEQLDKSSTGSKETKQNAWVLCFRHSKNRQRKRIPSFNRCIYQKKQSYFQSIQKYLERIK